MNMPMDPNPKSSKFKFAFTGTNCSGKTTMALDITSRLKMQGVLAEVVSSQDRKITWKDDHFPVDPRAHYGMITNLIHAEVQAELKGDAEVVITDRSVLDLYAIARYDHPESYMIDGLISTVESWLKTYTKVYYLAPLPYQADGKRPEDSFRMATHAKLRELMNWSVFSGKVVELSRHEVLDDILTIMGRPRQKPIWGETEKWQRVTDFAGLTLMVKRPTSPVSSDYDVWVRVPSTIKFLGEDLMGDIRKCINAMFGDQIAVHLMQAPDTIKTKLEGRIDVYQPAE